MARDLEALEDRLTVSKLPRGVWYVALWEMGNTWPTIVATFPREDEAWGVVSMILVNVDHCGMTEDAAIDLALRDYRYLLSRKATTADLDDDSRRAQDHRAEMGVKA